MTQVTENLKTISDNYDGYILDVWGVLHDGKSLFKGILETLAFLQKDQKIVYLLSNSPRLKSQVQQELVDLGISPDLYNELLTSGEYTHQYLSDRSNHSWVTVYFIGHKVHRTIIELNHHLKEVDNLKDADVIILSSPFANDDTIERYYDLLKEAQADHIPIICVNPDRSVVSGKDRYMCAGTIAEHYEEMGGKVYNFGKPYKDIYEAILAQMGIEPSRVLAIGDGLFTDIQGAHNADIDSALVTSGLHSADLKCRHGTLPEQEHLSTLLSQHNVSPTYILPGFIW